LISSFTLILKNDHETKQNRQQGIDQKHDFFSSSINHETISCLKYILTTILEYPFIFQHKKYYYSISQV